MELIGWKIPAGFLREFHARKKKIMLLKKERPRQLKTWKMVSRLCERRERAAGTEVGGSADQTAPSVGGGGVTLRTIADREEG